MKVQFEITENEEVTYRVTHKGSLKEMKMLLVSFLELENSMSLLNKDFVVNVIVFNDTKKTQSFLAFYEEVLAELEETEWK